MTFVEYFGILGLGHQLSQTVHNEHFLNVNIFECYSLLAIIDGTGVVLQIYGYRMSLWAEHLGRVDPLFTNAASLECVTEVNRLAQANWEQYVAEEVTDMKGHLMPYPINVNKDGTVGALPDWEEFPDVGGNILGTHQTNIPDSLTT